MVITPVDLQVTNITATSARLRWVNALQSLITSLFSSNEQGAFYIPMPVVLGTQALFQDAAGTTPVTADGDPVGKMIDQSGNGYHAIQSVSGSRPVYRTDGVLHWLEFDGVDDRLFNYDFSRSNPDSLFFALEWTSSFAGNKPLDGSFNNVASISVFPDGRIRAFSGGSGVISPAGSISLDEPYVGTAIFNLADSEIRINGASTGGTTGAMSTNGLIIGGVSNGAEDFSGKLFSVISLGRLASTSEIESVEAYLANLSGATL